MRPNDTPLATSLRFAHFSLDPRTHELRKNGRRLGLAEKPFLVLAALLERPGQLVTRDELRRRLWPADTFVDFDNNLNSAVAALRELLGDSARAPRFIETLPRLGYRFIAPLDATAPITAAPSVSLVRAARAPRLPCLWAVASLAAASLAFVIWLGSAYWTRPAASRPSAHSAPSQAYLDALYLLKRGNSESLRAAASLLARAVQQTPRDAAAHAALADAHLRLTLQGATPTETGFAAAESAARRALALGPALSSAHRTLAAVFFHRDWNFLAAEREAARAVELGPAESQNHLLLAGISAALGRHDAAIAAARRAIELDPADFRVRADLSYFLLAAGRFEEAAAETQAVLALEPAFAPALDFHLTAAAQLGRFADARGSALRLMELGRASEKEMLDVQAAPPADALHLYRAWQIRRTDAAASRQSWPPLTVASIYASAGRADDAFLWLERAYEHRDAWLVFLAASPDFASLRSDPRFSAFLRRLGLPASQPVS